MLKANKLLSILVIGAITLSACQRQEVSDKITVKTEKTATKDIESVVEIAGVLLPSETQIVSSKMTGMVSELNAQNGSNVKAGDVLVKLDTSELKSQLVQAEASLKSASAQVGVSKTNLSAAQKTLDVTKDSVSDQITSSKISLESAQVALSATVEQNTTQLNQSRIALEDAQRLFDRTEQLYNVGADSKNDYDNALNKLNTAKSALSNVESTTNTALTAAQSKVASALAAYEQAKGSAAENQVTGAQTKVDVAKKQYEVSSSSGLLASKAQIESIKTQMQNAEIKSAIDGTVVSQNVNLGELAATGTPLLTIANLNTLKLKGTISQEVLPFVQEGQKVQIFVDIYPGKTFEGTTEKIGKMAVMTGSYFPIEIKLDNSQVNLAAGISAHASVPVKSSGHQVVALSALVENDGEASVFVVENGVIKKHAVVTGVRNDNEVEILRGLKDGELVVTSQASNLVENMAVDTQ